MTAPRTRRLVTFVLLAAAYVVSTPSSAFCQAGATAPSAPLQENSAAPKARPGTQNQPAEPLTLSDQLTSEVLEPLRTGMQAQNITQVLSVFEPATASNMDLRSELQAFFRQYSQVQLRYQLLQATTEDDTASATGELQMDALPYSVAQVPERRSVRMRLSLKRESKRWEIVSFIPADFFSVEFAASSQER